MSNNKVNILLIEDDEVDIMNVRRSFKKNAIDHRLIVANDGVQALNMLFNGEIDPPPAIILLDINMPRMSGLEFLHHIRNDPVLKKISVYMLTTSRDERDKRKAYELNVAGYIQKPVSSDVFVKTIGTLNSFWGLIELPEFGAS